jgi:1,4-alpha-glucan branching enzyme
VISFMDERFGAWQVGMDEDHGAISFKAFFPDASLYDPVDTFFRRDDMLVRYDKPPEYGDPEIISIQIVGDFQEKIGGVNWEVASAPHMAQTPHESGTQWSFTTPVELPAGFYEYQYFVTYTDGTVRFVSDPCARYGGRRNHFGQIDANPRNNLNSGIVVGGSHQTVKPIEDGRKHLRDLMVYEINLDDFTSEYRGVRAPLDAVVDKLDHIQQLGFNALLVMPWTAWPGDAFNWGYEPYLYFAVSYRYYNDLNNPAEKLSYLKAFINECHRRGIHVIMDGVFNHVTGNGLFPYHLFYRRLQDREMSGSNVVKGGSSPFVGPFAGTFPGLTDLDFHNACLEAYVRDVCFYWMDVFGIDGIRFDNTVNFFDRSESPHGLPNLVRAINDHANDANFATILEHLELDASTVTNEVGATSYWNNAMFGVAFDTLYNYRVPESIMQALDTKKGLEGNRVATTYLSNHDHSHLAWQAGASSNDGSRLWYRTQPLAIALMTMPGSPMIQNGQEFAEDYWLTENDVAGRRVHPRPLHWGFSDDNIGTALTAVYRRLTEIRTQHAGLRSDNVYPVDWPEGQTHFDADGYGIDQKRELVIFHRWGSDDGGNLERFIVVLNFSAHDQDVDVPFSTNGRWRDLLNGVEVHVGGFRARVHVPSNWGRVYLNG